MSVGIRDMACPECGLGIETCATLGKIAVWGECPNHHSFLISKPNSDAKPVIEPDPHRARADRTRQVARGPE